ncbi:MAG: arginine--tRNA ligase [Heliobacteriaceae bacterium]|jgi:arginyl-tRNA synthetase|nr:arginine--tRNA ligase [Heliobacteriaceae bacterium]
MLKDYFLSETEKAITQAGFKYDQLSVERPKNPDFGDFAINISSLARYAKIPPPQIAAAIVEKVDKGGGVYSVAGGFINFKAGSKLLSDAIAEIFAKQRDFGKPAEIAPEKILLEYVSANPTGPFHIGHGRWAAMGSALANLLKFYGHEVYQEFYINDAGSQIEKLGNSLEIRVRQELGEDVDFPSDEAERKNFYAGEYLIPVAKKYVAQSCHSELDSESCNRDSGQIPGHRGQSVARNDMLDAKALADFAKAEMEAQQKTLLENFRVHFDNFYSEQALHASGKVEQSIEKLRKSGKIYEKDGAQWFKSSDYGDDQDRVIKKADGSNTYLTADIAYHIDKLERGFDRLINIWGADHHGYVARVRAAIEALGYAPAKLEVLLGQLVNLVINGEEVRMGKRKNMVTLEELICEVGVDATRFWMSMRNIDTTLDFDIELAKTNCDENPVFYVQYAHARACSILRNAVTERLDTATGEKLPAPLTQEEFGALGKASILPAIDTARQLILKLEEYKQVIKYSAQTRQVYTICRYVQELAAEFHSFYNANRVICDDKALMLARLALVQSVKTVLCNALEDILAVSAPERM